MIYHTTAKYVLAINFPLKCYIYAICKNYSMHINGRGMPISKSHIKSLAWTMWPGSLYKENDENNHDARKCMMMMTMIPQPLYIYWVGHCQFSLIKWKKNWMKHPDQYTKIICQHPPIGWDHMGNNLQKNFVMINDMFKSTHKSHGCLSPTK